MPLYLVGKLIVQVSHLVKLIPARVRKVLVGDKDTRGKGIGQQMIRGILNFTIFIKRNAI